MAKYRIGNNGKNDVNCELLTESAGKYIVRFGNGMIKGVEKDRIHSLDPVDVDVLKLVNESKLGDLVKGAADKVGEFGRRVGAGIKSAVEAVKEFVITRIVKSNHRIFFQLENGDFLQAIHPLNAMLAAGETNGISFIPSKEDVEFCKDLGITARSYEPEFDDDEYEGSAIVATDFAKVNEAEENIKGSFGVNERDRLKLTSDRFVDYNTEEIVEKLIAQYYQRYDNESDNTLAAPLVIFGAPGTGKTSIINSLKEELGVNVLTVNAANIEPESFTMPASVRRKGEGLKDTAIIKDLPKSWIPVYDSNVEDYPESEREFVLQQRKRAANGAVPNDEGIYESDGPGGFFFIDEFVRMTESGIASIFDFPLSRHLGQSSNITLGDRWVVVCASNRYTDLSGEARKAAVEFEAASKQRFEIINFVPTFEEWKVWAEKPRKGEKSVSNVNKHFVDFIGQTYTDPENPGAFYLVTKNEKAKDLNTKDPQVSPRRWEQYTSALLSFAARKPEVKKVIDDSTFPEGDNFVLEMLDNSLFRKTSETYLGTAVSKALIEYLYTLGVFSQADVKGILSDAGYEPTKKFLDEFTKNRSNVKEFLTRTVKLPFTDVVRDQFGVGGKLPDDGVYRMISFLHKVSKDLNDTSLFQVALDLMLKWSGYAGIKDLVRLPKSKELTKVVDPILFKQLSK